MAKRFFAALLALCGFSAPSVCGAASPGESAADHGETGIATYYGRQFEGKRTASGDTFRNDALMAAHPTYPFGTLALVTNLQKGYSVIVRIADRGPSNAIRRKGVIIDLSQSAAAQLQMIAAGRVAVRVRVLEWGRGYRDASRNAGRSDLHSARLHERDKVVSDIDL